MGSSGSGSHAMIGRGFLQPERGAAGEVGQLPKRLLVPVVQSPASWEALAVACAIAKAQRGTSVHVIHVIEVLRSLPLTAEMETEAQHGELVLRRATELASQLDCRVTTELLQARDAGVAIVEEAERLGADAVILGLGYKRLIGEFQTGRTVEYVFRHAPCQVWLIRRELPHERRRGAERERER